MDHHPDGCCCGLARSCRAWIIALVFLTFLAGIIAAALIPELNRRDSVASRGAAASCPASAAGRAFAAGAAPEPITCREIHAGLGVRKSAAASTDYPGGAGAQP